MDLSVVLFLPIFIRILFELFWRLTRKRFVFDTRNRTAWCLITGAGNGLGLEYAKLFAEKGYNLLLLSLLEDELVQAKRIISENVRNKELKDIQIHTLQVDFSQTQTCYESIERFLKPYLKDISVLLNNVGTDGRHCDYFDVGQCQQRNRLMIDVNLFSMTRMIEIILPQMKRNHNGLIISISSGAALTVSPLLAVYASTKAYIRTLMHALSVENARSGITFVTFTPYWISTNLTNNAPTNFFMPTAQTYAERSLSRIRHTRAMETIGYLPHEVLFAWTKLIGLLGGEQLEMTYLHWMMLQIRNFRKTLVAKHR